MASITSNSYSNRSITLDVWETGNYNAANSTREYAWSFYGSGSATGYVMAGGTEAQGGIFTAWVGGNRVCYDPKRIQLWQGTVIASGTTWVQHDNAGNKYVDMSCQAGVNTYAASVWASGGFWGSSVPRYANISNFWTTDITQTSFKYNVSTDVGIDWVQHSFNGGGWTDGGGQVIGGLTPGTGYNIKCRVRRTDSGLWTESWLIYPTTLAAGAITGANDFTDEGNGYFTYNNPGGSSPSEMKAGLYWNGSESLFNYVDVNKTGTLAYTFTLTEQQRTAIRERLKNVNSMTIVYYLRSTIGGNYYYSTLNKTISIVNAKPVMGGFKYQDTNATTKALTGSDQILIKGKSNVRVYDITATTLKAATKKTVIVESVGATWSDTYEKTLTAYAKNTIAVAMTDSRDNTADTMTKTVSWKEYFNITKGEQSAVRQSNGVGEAITLICKGTFWNNNFGAVANTITGTYKYKKTTSPTWITGTTAISITKSGNNFTIQQAVKGDTDSGFNIEESYDIEVTVVDKLSSQIFSISLIAGSPAMAIIGNKIALGGQFDETLTTKEIQMIKEVLFKKGIDVKGNAIISGNGEVVGTLKVKGQYVLGYTITKTW